MTISNLPRIAALGYYGFGNLGDEAVLAGIRRALSEEFVAHDFLTLSANPQETERLHPGVRTVDRWNWRAAAAALRGTDIFILGGGSLLQDSTSVRSVLWYTLMALLARRRARRVVWWGQGIGPLHSPLARRLVAAIANQADAISVRDEDSAQLLKAIGVRGSIHQAADPAFALQPNSLPSTYRAQTSAAINDTVLLALRRWKGDAFGSVFRSENIAAILGAGLDAERRRVVRALPMHLPDDDLYLRSLGDGGGDVAIDNWRENNWRPEQVLSLVQSAGLVVGMRLHALIFAARCAVPFVALSYDPKVDAIAKAAGQGDVLLAVERITSESLADAIGRVNETWEKRSNVLREFASAQGDKARIPARICRGLI